jgi:hypothetical protein
MSVMAMDTLKVAQAFGLCVFVLIPVLADASYPCRYASPNLYVLFPTARGETSCPR